MSEKVLKLNQVDIIKTYIDTKATIESPALTGTPTAPTASSGTKTTQIATTEFVNSAVSGAIGNIESLLGAI